MPEQAKNPLAGQPDRSVTWVMKTQTQTAPVAAPADVILTIAKEHFFVETLDSRNRDHLDFHEVSVVGMQRALQAAYQAGQEAALKGTK